MFAEEIGKRFAFKIYSFFDHSVKVPKHQLGLPKVRDGRVIP